MGQRISIQYSIDIDKLDDEVDRLLEKAYSELNALSNLKVKDSLSLSTLETIDNLRKGLGSVDATLQDVTAIVAGYINYKTSEKAQKPELAKSVASDDERKRSVSDEESPEVEYSF
tara:strand:- start:616 stop:963 length:348 start_codon:yes stop_codon:yes gene_type:complete